MKNNSTQNILDVAAELNVPNEKVSNVRQIENILFFNVNGREFDCFLTKTGKVRKNSVRVSRA